MKTGKRELIDKEPYMAKGHSYDGHFTHIIPFNLRTIGKGRIIINEDTEAQRDNMVSKRLIWDMSAPASPPPLEHDQQKK